MHNVSPILALRQGFKEKETQIDEDLKKIQNGAIFLRLARYNSNRTPLYVNAYQTPNKNSKQITFKDTPSWVYSPSPKSESNVEFKAFSPKEKNSLQIKKKEVSCQA